MGHEKRRTEQKRREHAMSGDEERIADIETQRLDSDEIEEENRSR